jgi:FkbM family methyltransferase
MQVIKNLKIYKPIRQWRISQTVSQWTDGDNVKLNFYKPFIETGSVVFDVGANIGKRTKVFLKLGARVVAIEPQKECAQILHLAFRNKIILVQKGLAEKEGFGEIRLDRSTTLSSMSNEWIEAVKTSGRFKDHAWTGKQQIETTTLDNLIQSYGSPSFIKIDVEGYEYQVLKGLTRRVNAISIENTPERFEAARDCIEYLATLGEIELNYSFGETMQWAFPHWIQKNEMILFLKQVREQKEEGMGDVYIKFT